MSTIYHAAIPVNLADPSRQRIGAAQLFMGDNNSHVFTALVADTDAPEAGLRAGTVSGTALRADGVTVALEGSKGADVQEVTFPNGITAQATPCSVTLPQAAFAVPGSLLISIKLTEGTTATTVLAVTGTVVRTETDAAVDPGEILPDLAELQAAAAEALAAAYEARDVMDEAESIIESMPAIFPQEAKMALLTCLTKVAWTDEHGQDYYDALYAALFPEVYVVSISATYTQTGDVMDTDTLDSLRADLVVTARYSNGVVTPVSNYTLAGDLTAGECTILVLYANFTTSFTVEVLGVPSGYTQYDYVENTMINSSGGHPAWYAIDIGLNSRYCDTQYIHELTFWNTDNTTSQTATSCIFGARPAGGSAGSAGGVNLWFVKTLDDKYAVGYNGADSGYNILEDWGVKHTMRLEDGNILFDNVIVKTQSATRETFTDATIWLFGCGSAVSGAVAYSPNLVRIYSYRVTDSVTGEVISDCVACTDPDGKAGVYDKIRRQFYYANQYANFHCANEV